MVALPFSYAEPSPGLPGSRVDINAPETVNTLISADGTPEGLSAGQAVFAMGNTSGGYQTFGTVTRQCEAHLTAAVGANRRLAGFVDYVQGKPGELYLPRYDYGEAVPVVSQGRRWLIVENVSLLDPMSCGDAFFVRINNSPTSGTGNVGCVRYGDADPDASTPPVPSCVQIPVGTFRILRRFNNAPGLHPGTSLCAVEFDFRSNTAFGG